MKFPLSTKVKIGYLIAFGLFILSNILLFIFTEKMFHQIKRAEDSKTLIGNLESLNSALKNLQNSYKNYLLNENNQTLENYNNAKIIIGSSLNRVGISIYDSINNSENHELKILVNKVIENFESGIIKLGDEKTLLSNSKKNTSFDNKLIIDSVNSQIETIKNREVILSFKNQLLAKENFQIIKVISFTAIAIAVFILIFSLFTFFTKNNLNLKANEQELIYRTSLQQKIKELDKNGRDLNDLRSAEKFAVTGRMARMIAHEVRNPLTNIGLANDQLKDAVEPNEENLMLLNMIKKNGERINHLVGDLLNATKFVDLNLSEFAINDLLDEVILMVMDKIKLREIKITRNYSPKMCSVLVDADKIKIAFYNIIVNSIETVKYGVGEIEIITTSQNNMCKVVIRDNGEGMNNEVMSNIFEPYFNNKDKGNGLSLTNSQNIILNHKGKISVDSEIGKGSNYIIDLDFAHKIQESKRASLTS